MTLYEQYASLCAALRDRECESCGGPAQHVDPDGGTFCFECARFDRKQDAVMYPGVIDGVWGEES